MAEENLRTALDDSGASTPLPPIDNIHSTEPNLPISAAPQVAQHPYLNGDQMDAEMTEAAVR